jgi:lactate permease
VLCSLSSLNPLLAAIPILAILFLMLIPRWSAVRAGLVGMTLAFILAWWAFGYGITRYPEIGPGRAASGALAEAVHSAATILWIIFPALCIHQMQLAGGAIDTLRLSIGRLAGDLRLTVILVAWFFALFLEGAAGFGTTIALTAPFLVGIGFRPVDAVTLALIGHSIGVSFGAVGTPIIAQVSITGLTPLELARATGFYHSVLAWVMAYLLMRAASRSMKSLAARRSPLGWTLLAALLFLFPFTLIYYWVGPELPTLGGALIGGLGFVAVIRLTGSGSPEAENSPGPAPRLGLPRAGAPYLVVVGLILLTRLPQAIQARLSGYSWRWTLWGHFEGDFGPLYHPGTILLLGFLLGGLVQGAKPAELRAAAGRAIRQLSSVSLALLAMLTLSRVLVHATMIETLALAASLTIGAAWPLLSPFVGVLGTFVTGSATASNILFTDFQQATAENLRMPVLPLIGAQGFGAAVGNIICPHNIIAGGATVGISGQEGAVLSKTLVACLLYALLGGALAFLLTWFA